MIDLEIAPVARRVVEELGGVGADEEVLVIADPGTVTVARALAVAARAAGADATLSVMPRMEAHGAEPPAVVAGAMAAADAVFAANEHSIAHTEARKAAADAGARVAILRGVTPEMMVEGAMTADYAEVRELTAAMCGALAAADRAHMTAPAGTDVEMSLAGRRTIPIDGDFHDYGFSNLPPGMAVTSPVEGTAEGRIALDHSMDGVGRLEEPIELGIEGGNAVEIEGGEAAATLRGILEGADGNPYNLAEFAIGTNPAARLTGNLAEDKKKAGTVDVALGDSSSIGGTVESSVHLDAVVTRPTVSLDGTVVVEGGEIDREAVRAVAGK